jgi:3-hydroxyacyl-[acyl-carrier-protein] dehydratase
VLLVEAMAQLLGWLVSYSNDFRCLAVLALISDVTVPAALPPGIRAEIDGRLLSTTASDSLGTATATVDGQIVAKVERLISITFHCRPARRHGSSSSSTRCGRSVRRSERTT